MLGQEKFIEKLNKFNLGNLPHSLMFMGDVGSGQQEACKYLADRLGFEVIDITEKISTETINQLYLTAVPTFYVVNINAVSEKEQNELLKVFEEPTMFTYLILYGDSNYNVLDTIVNRSYVIQMERYTEEQLRPLVTNQNVELTLSVCNTPGQIETANHTDMLAIKTLCDKMATVIKTANLANTLTISNKINFKDEYHKFDLSLFIKMLGRSFMEHQENDLYSELLNMQKYIPFMNDKKSYFDYFLMRVWRKSRGEQLED